MKLEIAIGVSFIALIIIVIFLIKRKRKYTRERFAFYSTLLIFSFAATIYTHIFSNNSLINIFLILFNELPLQDIPLQNTSWSDKLWSILFLIMLMGFVIHIFNEWRDNGCLSTADYELKAVNKELQFLRAALNGIPYKPLTIFTPTREEKRQKINDLYFLDTTLDWHSELKELLSLSSHQYKINSTDWYPEYSSYLAKYSTDNILLYCAYDSVSSDKVEQAIDYFKSKKDIFKVVVAFRQTKQIPSNREYKGCTIEYTTKTLLLDRLVDFEDYYTYLKESFYSNEISLGDKLSLSDIYVESSGKSVDLIDDSKSVPIDNVESFLTEWANSEVNDQHISLLGEYGQGKSALSLKLALNLIESKSPRIPIIIELRGKSPRNETMADIIASWAHNFSINVKAIQKLLQEGRLVIILEGFDELDMVGDELRRLEHFKKLWEFARFKKSKVMITGRPNLFLNNREARSYLHLNNDSSALFQVSAVHLEPFSKEKIALALRSTSQNISNQILDVYDKGIVGTGFNDLISRPSTLYQTSVIWHDLDKRHLNSASIIQEFINHAYRRQEEKLRTRGNTGIEPPVLTLQERSYFMQGIAVAMVKLTSYSNHISLRTLHNIVVDLFCEIPESISKEHSSGRPLNNRIEFDIHGVNSVFNDVRASGILVRELTSIDTFKFSHKSFLEFLFAKYAVGLIEKDENEIIYNTIAKSLEIEKNLYRLNFSDEVIEHIVEILLYDIRTFDNNSASLLLDKINPKLKTIDKFAFRRIFGFSFIGYLTILLLIALNITLYSYNADLKGFMIVNLGLIINMLYCSIQIKQSFIKSEYPSFKIWRSSCNKLNFNPESALPISERIISFFDKKYSKIDKFYLGVFKFISPIFRPHILASKLLVLQSKKQKEKAKN